MIRSAGRLVIAAMMAAAALPTFAQHPLPVVAEAEESDVATLSSPGPYWIYITNTFGSAGTRVIDGATGKFLATIHGANLADFAADRAGKAYYVAESIWTRGNRGTRQDMISVYDPATLKLLGEIDIPGRLLIGNRSYNFATSSDGRHGFVFNMDPATSIIVVDLVKRKYIRSVELPGCTMVLPGPGGTTASLCGDGSIATVRYGAKPVITHSPAFFSPDEDPVFDNSFVDTRTGKALLLSYSGLIYDVQLGAEPRIAQPWSIQTAGGVPAGETRPLLVNWFPGGRQPIAYHRDSGRAYVLMHMGEYWTHKASAEEVWEVDVAARKVLRRIKSEEPADYVAVSQGPSPLLYLNSTSGKLRILDVATAQLKHKLDGIGSGNLTVAGN